LEYQLRVLQKEEVLERLIGSKIEEEREEQETLPKNDVFIF
jgi:hypothetical protein